MIKVNELRVGNLVLAEPISHRKSKETVIKIVSIDKRVCDNYYTMNGFMWDQQSYVGYEEKHLNPIPLTEEWLLKFGFVDFKKRVLETDLYFQWLYSHDGFVNPNNENSAEVYLSSDIGDDSVDSPNTHIGKIYYVHQLQNLYFALTGTELKII